MWFEMIDYWQGRLIFAAIFLLLVCCGQSYEANKEIHRINEENSDKYYMKRLPTAPVGGMILIIVLLVIAFITPLSK